MSERIESIDRRLAVLREKESTNSKRTSEAWMQLAEEYNVPSYVIENFYSSAYHQGADTQQSIDLRTLKAELTRKKRRSIFPKKK